MAVSKGSSALPPPRLGPASSSVSGQEAAESAAASSPCAGGTGSRPAALEGMVLGEGDAGLGGQGRERGAVGRAVGSRRTGMEPGVGG